MKRLSRGQRKYLLKNVWLAARMRELDKCSTQQINAWASRLFWNAMGPELRGLFEIARSVAP